MRKLLLMLLLVALTAEWIPAQEIPRGVQEIIDNYVKDSTIDCGFLFVKKWLHLDSSLKSSDIEVGIPIEEYDLRYDVLDTCSETIPVRKLIKPINYWLMPVRAHGRYIYEVEISKSSGSWKMIGCSELCDSQNLWKDLRKSYPESSGINPIIIRDGRCFFYHFPQKGDYNLLPVRPISPDDSLSLIMSKSFDSLDDSRKILKYRIREWNDQREMREKAFKNMPNPFNNKGNENGGDNEYRD